MEVNDGLTTSVSEYDENSSRIIVNSSMISGSASLYESSASLAYSDISSVKLDALQLEDIVSKNKKGFEVISNRLTSLGYFISELTDRRNQNKSHSMSQPGSDRISESSKSCIENGDILPAEVDFIEKNCQKIVIMTRSYEEQGRNLEKNQKEIESLEDELIELNGRLGELLGIYKKQR